MGRLGDRLRPMLDYEIVPPTAGKAHAACIVLHGLGDSREGWRPIASAFLPPGVATVLVDAPDPYAGGGFSWFPIPGITGPGDGDDQRLAAIRRNRVLLFGLIGQVLDELELAPEQLLLMGFSQGCCMVLEAALRDPRRFAGVLGISGFLGDLEDLPGALSPVAREQRILWTHGRYDPLIPLGWAETCRQILVGWDIPVDFRVFDKEHSVDPAEELPQLQAWIEERLALPRE